MTTTPERRTATLSELVAEEIRAIMGRRRMSQAQLARAIGKTEMWISLRLRGRQELGMNDLHLIAGALEVGVHDLMPPPDVAKGAADPRSTHGYSTVTDHLAGHTYPTKGNRPPGHPSGATRPGPGRTAYVTRGKHGR